MHILGMKAERIKRIVSVNLDLTEQGRVIQITGRNGQGKTSLCDAIWYALGGTKAMPDDALNRDASKGMVELTLGEKGAPELTVRRNITRKGTTLHVERADGGKVTSPQSLLNNLVGFVAFDPLEFSRMSGKQQAETLRKLDPSLDFSKLDAKRNGLFMERTDINREVKRLEAIADQYPRDIKQVPERVSVNELMQELSAVERQHHEHERIRDHAIGARERADERMQEIRNLECELKKQRELAETETKAAEAAEANAKDLPQLPDTDAIREKIANAEDINAQVDAHERHVETIKELEVQKATTDELTRAIEGIDEEKRAALDAANLPVDGLAYAGDTVTLNGIEFSEASGREKIATSIAIQMALNPKLRMMILREANGIDSEGMQQIADMADEHDYQILMEYMDESGERGVVIEDGKVANQVKSDEAA